MLLNNCCSCLKKKLNHPNQYLQIPKKVNLNASRSRDRYFEYTGVPAEELLADAGILNSATGITVYVPDGWSNYHLLEPDPEGILYHFNGIYPEAPYYYDPQDDIALNPTDGWCDYSAPSTIGRNHLDPIYGAIAGTPVIQCR